jgi:hypothetical protein
MSTARRKRCTQCRHSVRSEAYLTEGRCAWCISGQQRPATRKREPLRGCRTCRALVVPTFLVDGLCESCRVQDALPMDWPPRYPL